MSLSASPVPFSLKLETIRPIHDNNNKFLLNPFSVSKYQAKPFELRLKTAEKTENYDKKYGTQKFKKKSENKSEAYIQPKMLVYDSFTKENWFNCYYRSYIPNLSSDSNFFVGKKLEFEMSNWQEWRPYWVQRQSILGQNSYFGAYFPERNLFPDKIFLSKIFDKNLENSKNFYLTQPYPNLFLIPKEMLLPKVSIPKARKEKENKRIKAQEIIKHDELIKLNFKVPNEFLISFQIKEIEVKTIDLNQFNQTYEKSKIISFQDMETYINKLCQKVLNKNKFDTQNELNKEYIEIENAFNEENIYNFLQKKRTLSKDEGDSISKINNKSCINAYFYRRHPLKKKYKKINNKLTLKLKNLIKLNNSKNGNYTSVNLNQIQINKKGLENFPFHPLLNSKEILTISFLKGIAERKDLIRIKKNVKLTKDLESNKYLNDKKFKIVYLNTEDDTKYIVHISGINILYLILYYYYQIHKSIKTINAYHYSHAAFYKSLNEINKAEVIIKKCNHIIKEISK